MNMIPKIHSTSALLLCAALAGPALSQSNELQPPVRILAGGKPIDVTTGHAAPYVLDFDGDGKRDLLVGEFGDGDFPVEQLPAKLEKGWKQPDAFANGRVRIYKNHGTDAEPRFQDFVFLQAGGADATVPIT
jgi:hypothetical protein